jgi:predicted dienelactone hydrolase
MPTVAGALAGGGLLHVGVTSTPTKETAVRLMAVITALFALAATPAFAADVGFEEVRIANGAEPPLTAGIWYPTSTPATPHALGNVTQIVAPGAPVAGRRLPLVVMSHGGGGWYDGHYDTALALAHAGFVVASVSHAGDTFNDQPGVAIVAPSRPASPAGRLHA